MRLTERQAEWYRRLVQEERDAGATEEEAWRETYIYWNECVRDDWRAWVAANERKTDDELTSMLRAAVGVATLFAILRNPSPVRQLIERTSESTSRALAMLTSDE